MLQNLKKAAEATIDSIVNKNEDKMKPQDLNNLKNIRDSQNKRWTNLC